jgi:hypothetical protein
VRPSVATEAHENEMDRPRARQWVESAGALVAPHLPHPLTHNSPCLGASHNSPRAGARGARAHGRADRDACMELGGVWVVAEKKGRESARSFFCRSERAPADAESHCPRGARERTPLISQKPSLHTHAHTNTHHAAAPAMQHLHAPRAAGAGRGSPARRRRRRVRGPRPGTDGREPRLVARRRRPVPGPAAGPDHRAGVRRPGRHGTDAVPGSGGRPRREAGRVRRRRRGRAGDGEQDFFVGRLSISRACQRAPSERGRADGGASTRTPSPCPAGVGVGRHCRWAAHGGCKQQKRATRARPRDLAAPASLSHHARRPSSLPSPRSRPRTMPCS